MYGSELVCVLFYKCVCVPMHIKNLYTRVIIPAYFFVWGCINYFLFCSFFFCFLLCRVFLFFGFFASFLCTDRHTFINLSIPTNTNTNVCISKCVKKSACVLRNSLAVCCLFKMKFKMQSLYTEYGKQGRRIERFNMQKCVCCKINIAYLYFTQTNEYIHLYQAPLTVIFTCLKSKTRICFSYFGLFFFFTL